MKRKYDNKTLENSDFNTVNRISGQVSIEPLNTLDYIVYFLMGIFIFSRFSAFIILEKLEFAFYIPELLYIPFILYLFIRHKRIFILLINNNQVQLFFIITSLLILIFWSSYFNQDGARYIISTSRSYFYISLFTLIGYNLSNIKSEAIFSIALGSTLTSFIWLLFFHDYDEIYYVSLTSVFLCVLIPILKKKYILVTLVTSIVIIIGIYSALRRVYIVLILAFVLGLVINIHRGKSIYRLIPIIFISMIFLFKEIILNMIVSISSRNDFIYKRIVSKTLETIYGGGATGDIRRISNIENIFNHAAEFYYPHGFLTKNTDITGNGLFMDLPLYELFYTFGSILVIPFIIYLIYKTITMITKIEKSNLTYAYYIVPFTIILHISYLFYDGGFLLWPYYTIFTGLFLGFLFNKNFRIV